MHDRIALITGGGSGIGAACARRFVEDGYRVMITGRRTAPLAELSAALGADRVSVCAGDVSDPADAARMVRACLDAFDRLDVLVNNAGVYRPEPVAQQSLESWRESFAINLDGPFLLSQQAHPALKRSEAGVVVNVLSTLAHRVAPGVAAYCASKAALLSLTRTLSLEWAGDGIRVVAVSPGIVNTPIHGADISETLADLQPLGRVGRPEEIADAVAFVASAQSAWTTGANFDVDGGIQWR